MNKIRILPENISNMIAAGEVVERPASVVKELVENSLDAGSSRIEVTVRDGGKKLIRVADNGNGMSRADALLSLERHATSKIENVDDLNSISTMGFRGEALASIASVSKMTILTQEKDMLEGTEIFVEGGTIRDVRAAGLPSGTIAEVKDLFFNTPARRKFLKTTTTEMGHITDYVARTALAFPAISFVLRSEKTTVFDLPSGSGILDRASALLGRDDTGNLIKMEEDGCCRISGLISPPSLQRSTASGLYIYINGRFVKDRVVRHAVLQGYSSYIMKGRYPLVIIFLEIAPEEVDVNVHPAKNEVRFRNSGAVHSFVSAAVEKTLRNREWLEDAGGAEREQRVMEAAAEYVAGNGSLPLSGGYTLREYEALKRNEPRGGCRDVPETEEAAVEKACGAYFSSLQVIGHLDEMYILCRGMNGLVIIDQHAAYERMAYEELKSDYEKRSFRSQTLLIPETLELPPKEAAALEENINEVQRLGFGIEPFGGRSFVVNATPSILGGSSVKDMISDIAAELSDGPASSRFSEILDGIIKRLACHSVIRGRRRMSHDEMRDLLKRMDSAGIVPHCPHGRPAHVDIPIAEIEKRFERI